MWLVALMQKGVKMGLKTRIWCKFKIPPFSAEAGTETPVSLTCLRGDGVVPSRTAKYNIANKN